MFHFKYMIIFISFLLSLSCSPQSSVFRLEGELSGQQITLLQLAMNDWCNMSTIDEFCTSLGDDGDSQWIGVKHINGALGRHVHTNIIKNEIQWSSKILIENTLANDLFYYVALHELGHHFCLSHRDDNSIMGSWDTLYITPQLASEAGCKLNNDL